MHDTREPYDDEGERCDGCDAFGDWQCDVHGPYVLAALRAVGTPERRLQRRAERAGVALTDAEIAAALEACDRAPPDWITRRGPGSPARRVDLERWRQRGRASDPFPADDDLPF